MRWLSNILFRLKAVVVPKRMEDELDEEMAFHLEMEVQKLTTRGLSPESARSEALKNFGEPLRQREKAREAWGVRWVGDLRSDVRLAARAARKSPVLSVTAIFTLALGIGGATAVFSVVNGVLLKPLPYPDPDGLVVLNHTMPGIGNPSTPLGPALFRTYRDHSRTLEDIGLWQAGARTVTGSVDPERVAVWSVTETLLPMLGLEPVLGRGFNAEDTSAGSENPVILTYEFWQSHFGGDPDVIRRTIEVNGAVSPILGVLPPDGSLRDRNVSLILPIRLDRTTQGVGNWSFASIARLGPGLTPEQVGEELSSLTPLACELYPGIPLEELERRQFGTIATPMKTAMIGGTGPVLWVLFGTVGIVLLLACTNVMNLFLVKAERRARDVALRKALGASRERLLRQSVAESLTLALVGGGLGVWLAHLGVGTMIRHAPPALPRLSEIDLGPTVLLFTFLLTLGAGLAFGIGSTIREEDHSLSDPLKDGSRGAGGGRSRIRTRNTLAVVQVALALVLLVGSGLMIRTFKALRNVPPGYQRPEEVITFRVSLPPSEFPTLEDVAAGFQEIHRRLAEVPGVTSVSGAASVAMEAWAAWEDLLLEDFPVPEGDPNPLRRLNWITPGHFATMQNPLLAGHPFEWADVLERRNVAIVSETLAREFWAGPQEALGKRFRMGEEHPWKVIIGVAGDVRALGVTEAAPAMVYFPYVMDGLWGPDGFSQRGLRFSLRTERRDPLDLLAEARQAVWGVNPRLPLSNIRTLEEIFAGSIAQTSFIMTLLVTASLVAVILGMTGVYGVISYVVSQRTREMGIRMAMGATAETVRTMVLKQAGVLASLGVGIGLLVALALSRLLVSLLFGVGRADPPTYVAVSVALIVVVLLASYLPARRAAFVDPTEALKSD
jgi:predicted permease